MNQTNAILRLLGRRHGYYFDDNVDEAFNVDWALETHADFWNTKTYRLWLFTEENDAEKITEGATLFEAFNKKIEAHLTSVNSRFIASDRLTIADFVVFSLYINMTQNEAVETPDLQAAFAAKLEDTPKVKAYIETMKQEMESYMTQRGAYKI